MKHRGGCQSAVDTGSPPVWGRGLKLHILQKLDYSHESPPVWGRGLKRARARRRVVTDRRPPCGGVD